MKKLPNHLISKLEIQQDNSLRQLCSDDGLIDFTSNDYIGFSKSSAIFQETHQFLDTNCVQNGATGSS
jgi:8-amino-7-oxononanoate synthase